MDRKSIITLPHVSLRTRSKKVSHVDEKIHKIVKDMQSATLDWEEHRKHELGVALAAVQVNKLVKLIVLRSNTEDKADTNFDVLINPEIIRKSDDITLDYEGCLSIPDVYGLVPRANKVKVKALNTKGQEIRLHATGMMARTLQHEIDHTYGTLFIDHIKDDTQAFFKLDESGELIPLDYEKDVKDNENLWQ